MRVDVDEMRAGADRSYDAAWLAAEGADLLAATGLTPRAFGDFSAAESFREALGNARGHHVQRLREQRDHLGKLGDAAHTAASALADMERRNAEAMRAVLWPNTRT